MTSPAGVSVTPLPTRLPTSGPPKVQSAPVRVNPRGEVARSALEGTPGRMRIAAALAVLACLIFGIAGGAAFRGWGGALADARADSAQLVRIQTVQNDLVKADAAASNAYLAGGVENRAARTTYDTAINEASRLVAEAAATTSDSTTLQEVASAITRYHGLVEQARSNNRQGLQVGAAYLRQAGTVLRSEIVPALETVSQADQQRVAAAYRRINFYTGLLIGAAALTLAALLGVQAWLAGRTRRIVNVPLAIATVAVLVGVVGGLSVLRSAADTASWTAQGPYAATVDLASARTAAFDAKAQESLGLIARGNAASYESISTKQIAKAEAGLAAAAAQGGSDDLPGLFDAWVAAHQSVRDADNDGRWVDARALATGASNTAFETFDKASTAALAAQAKSVDDDLGRPRTALIFLGWLVLGLGILAAVASLIGIGQRLGEYR